MLLGCTCQLNRNTPHGVEWNLIYRKTSSPTPTDCCPGINDALGSQILWQKWQNDCPAPTEIGIQAYTDTCVLTCTSDPEILSMLQYHSSYLLLTTHRIDRIMDKPLDIMGALLLHIKSNGLDTQQVVYMAQNVTGFYISATAMKDLDLISPNFPTSRVTTNAANKLTLDLATCGFDPCKDPPNHLASIPFEPTHENHEKIEKLTMHPVLLMCAPISLYRL